MEFLCQQKVAECQNFIQGYPDPLTQLIWLVFFPLVFLVIFIYFLSGVIITHKGMRTLLAVAIYLFIIFSNWYYIVLIVSKFWYVSLIILGGLGIFVHKMSGGGNTVTQRALSGGGSSEGGWAKVPGIIKYGLNRAKDLGDEDSLIKAIEELFKMQEGILNEMKKPSPGTNIGTVINGFRATRSETEDKIKLLEEKYGYTGKKTLTPKLWKRQTYLTERFNKLKP